MAHRFNTHDDGHYPIAIHVGLGRALVGSTSLRVDADNLPEPLPWAFELSFEQGKLRSVKSSVLQNSGAIKIPPLLFAPLLLGYRAGGWLGVVDGWAVPGSPGCAVSKLESFIFTIY